MEFETFLTACRLGDIQQLQELIQKDPSLIHYTDPTLRCTSLFRTVICEQLEATKTLLEFQADPNQRNSVGETPLHHATDKLAIAKLLVDYGADPNLAQRDGDTPLHYAALKGHSQLTDFLVSCGAKVNIQNNLMKASPLHYAVDTDNIEVAQVLLQAQASLSLLNSNNKTPADLVKTEGMKLLLHKFMPAKPKSVFRSKTAEVSEKMALTQEKTGCLTDRNPLRVWLRAIRLEELFGVLLEAGYDDPEQMMSQMHGNLPINDTILKAIGVQKSGHRRRLLAALFKPGVKLKQDKPGMFRCCVAVIPSQNDVMHLPSLSRWLEGLGLRQLLTLFVMAGYDSLESLLSLVSTPWELDDEALAEIGVAEPNVSAKILEKLRTDSHHFNLHPKTSDLKQSCGIY